LSDSTTVRRAKGNDNAQDHYVELRAGGYRDHAQGQARHATGPQPIARAIVTTHLQKLRSDLALP